MKRQLSYNHTITFYDKRGDNIKKLEKAEELIERMKNKNIQFNEAYSEEQAVAFLKGQSYYKKITSYQNNFQYSNIDGKKKYMNLDFAYLVELSKLDMEFRFLVIRMCLNIEHAAKVYIINKCIENGEDGYSIVEEYF